MRLETLMYAKYHRTSYSIWELVTKWLCVCVNIYYLFSKLQSTGPVPMWVLLVFSKHLYFFLGGGRICHWKYLCTGVIRRNQAAINKLNVTRRRLAKRFISVSIVSNYFRFVHFYLIGPATHQTVLLFTTGSENDLENTHAHAHSLNAPLHNDN